MLLRVSREAWLMAVAGFGATDPSRGNLDASKNGVAAQDDSGGRMPTERRKAVAAATRSSDWRWLIS